VELPADFAFYGTLRRGGGGLERLGLELEWLSPCVIIGSLYRVSWYPALADDGGTVVGDLFRIDDPALVDEIDRFEGFDAASPRTSLYVRRQVTLEEPGGVAAWVYVWNRPIDGLERIPSGDWLAAR
jgi:gamma-glutamylcyclotransferase (GGCT)/AIG2-like uncharacterized protein YtfP